MGRIVFFLIATVACLSSNQGAATLPADISFMVADFKYNSVDGIKICEIQQGILSRFRGYDHSYEGEGLVGNLFCEALMEWNDKMLFMRHGIAEITFIDKLLAHNWLEINLFNELGSYSKPENIQDIRDYEGILYTKGKNAEWYNKMAKVYPGLLVMNRATISTERNKLLMSNLLNSDPVLKKYKPKWGCYKTKYTTTIANEIINDLGSEMFVIKPLSCFMGKGVIIIHKDNLDNLLRVLFKKKNELSSMRDPAYSHWADCYDKEFIVEEFIQSDSLLVPHLDNKYFDGTMRTAFVLIYDKGEIYVKILGSYWKLPYYPITYKGTLNQTHKTDYLSSQDHQNSVKVSPEIIEIVHGEFEKILPILYQKMLEDN